MTDQTRQSELSKIADRKVELERQNQEASKKLDTNKTRRQDVEKRNTANADKQAVITNRMQELTSLQDQFKNEQSRIKAQIKIVKQRIKADKKLHADDK